MAGTGKHPQCLCKDLVTLKALTPSASKSLAPSDNQAKLLDQSILMPQRARMPMTKSSTSCGKVCVAVKHRSFRNDESRHAAGFCYEFGCLARRALVTRASCRLVQETTLARRLQFHSQHRHQSARNVAG